ncbi:MAG: hypothetical protein HY747_12035, partial [Elusimicrobia bacterium]|nr:hypothetical protein [Elusimicrobiota bacterium]
MPELWIEKIKAYCQKYNIPIQHLPDTINEPKVIPMIRGKAYEFSVAMSLEEILDHKKWEISKPYINAQTGLHDIDLQAKHILTQKSISLECKLAAKGRFRKISNSSYKINVKCMRSRTLGAAKVKELAPQIGVSPAALLVHNDQYRFQDFDFVVTSIGNAFYETDQSGVFEWRPSLEGKAFLGQLSHKSIQEEKRDCSIKVGFMSAKKFPQPVCHCEPRAKQSQNHPALGIATAPRRGLAM